MSAPTLESSAGGRAAPEPAPASVPVRARASRRACLVITLVLLVVGLYDVKAHVPANILALPGRAASVEVMNSLLPQGWAFFTRSPREAGLRVYPVRDGALGGHAQPANAEPGNLFGLDRDSRSQGTEIGLLNAAVPDEAWVACEGPRDVCLPAALEAALAGDLPSIVNTSLVQTICGPVVLSGEEPTAWAYRDLVDDRWRSVEYAAVEVTC